MPDGRERMIPLPKIENIDKFRREREREWRWKMSVGISEALNYERGDIEDCF